MRLAHQHTEIGLNRVFNILITCCLLASCSTYKAPAPVSDRRQPPSIKLQTHRVSTGETLYAIAWRYGIDYKHLARHNGISRGYTIYPGQLLRLDVNSAKTRKPAPRTVVKSKPQSAPKTQPRSIKTTKKVANTKASQMKSAAFKWQWPVKGKLLATFSSANGLNKGIDIAGKLGESVLSAGPGDVVYAGNGLRGYGNLLIIKHNQKYLSAYAHNRRLLVGEGDSVKAGQKIAELGSSGTDRNKLHFEIRRDGKPIDPLKYLPRR